MSATAFVLRNLSGVGKEEQIMWLTNGTVCKSCLRQIHLAPTQIPSFTEHPLETIINNLVQRDSKVTKQHVLWFFVVCIIFLMHGTHAFKTFLPADVDKYDARPFLSIPSKFRTLDSTLSSLAPGSLSTIMLRRERFELMNNNCVSGMNLPQCSTTQAPLHLHISKENCWFLFWLLMRWWELNRHHQKRKKQHTPHLGHVKPHIQSDTCVTQCNYPIDRVFPRGMVPHNLNLAFPKQTTNTTKWAS